MKLYNTLSSICKNIPGCEITTQTVQDTLSGLDQRTMTKVGLSAIAIFTAIGITRCFRNRHPVRPQSPLPGPTALPLHAHAEVSHSRGPVERKTSVRTERTDPAAEPTPNVSLQDILSMARQQLTDQVTTVYSNHQKLMMLAMSCRNPNLELIQRIFAQATNEQAEALAERPEGEQEPRPLRAPTDKILWTDQRVETLINFNTGHSTKQFLLRPMIPSTTVFQTIQDKYAPEDIRLLKQIWQEFTGTNPDQFSGRWSGANR